LLYVKAYQAKFNEMPTFNSSAATTGSELIGVAIEKCPARRRPIRFAMRRA
jgi:hypothetical protein